MLAPFWHNCPYFLHAFFEHRFCIDSVTFFHDFLDVQNHVFYCKTNSFVHFSLFQKSMNFHRFWSPFWHHFGSLLPLIFDTFSASNFACLFGWHFFDFWPKMAPKIGGFNVYAGTFLAPRTAPKMYLKRHPKIDAEKLLKINRKRLPKWCQNGY